MFYIHCKIHAVILGKGEGAQRQGDPEGQRGTGNVAQQRRQA